MKYCTGKFHGEVKKQIDDNEDYCLLCKSRMEAEKQEKKEKTKKNWANIGKGAVGVAVLLDLGLKIVNLFKKGDKS